MVVQILGLRKKGGCYVEEIQNIFDLRPQKYRSKTFHNSHKFRFSNRAPFQKNTNSFQNNSQPLYLLPVNQLPNPFHTPSSQKRVKTIALRLLPVLSKTLRPKLSMPMLTKAANHDAHYSILKSQPKMNTRLISIY